MVRGRLKVLDHLLSLLDDGDKEEVSLSREERLSETPNDRGPWDKTTSEHEGDERLQHKSTDSLDEDDPDDQTENTALELEGENGNIFRRSKVKKKNSGPQYF